MPKIGRMGPAIVASKHANVPGKSGILTGIRLDWQDRSTAILDIESGTGHQAETQTVRIPSSQSDKYKLGQRLTVETKLVGNE